MGSRFRAAWSLSPATSRTIRWCAILTVLCLVASRSTSIRHRWWNSSRLPSRQPRKDGELDDVSSAPQKTSHDSAAFPNCLRSPSPTSSFSFGSLTAPTFTGAGCARSFRSSYSFDDVNIKYGLCTLLVELDPNASKDILSTEDAVETQEAERKANKPKQLRDDN